MYLLALCPISFSSFQSSSLASNLRMSVKFYKIFLQSYFTILPEHYSILFIINSIFDPLSLRFSKIVGTWLAQLSSLKSKILSNF